METMSIKEIIKLVLKSRRYSKQQMLEITDNLFFGDAIQYILWLEKLLLIKLEPAL